MGFADLHIHTLHSHDGTSTIPAILKYVADQTDLNVIAITDHDTMAGVKEALLLGPRYGIEVIPGCEISTAEGHLLALFITQPIPAGLSLMETVRRVGQQGGICVAPHPEARCTSSLSGKAIRAALADPELARTLVGIETYNSGLFYQRGNLLATRLARTLDLAWVGNSDSHVFQTISVGATEFAGHSAADLRRALESGATRVRKSQGLKGIKALQQWVIKFMLLKLGWVTWNAGPAAPLRYARLKDVLSRSLAAG